MSSSPFCTMRGDPAQLAAFTQTDRLMPSVGPMVSWLGTVMNVRRIGGELQRGADLSRLPVGAEDVHGPAVVADARAVDRRRCPGPRPASSGPPARGRRSGGPGGTGTSGANGNVEFGRRVAARHPGAAARPPFPRPPLSRRAAAARCAAAARVDAAGVERGRPAGARPPPTPPVPPLPARCPRCRPRLPASRPSVDPSPVRTRGPGRRWPADRTPARRRPPGSLARRCCAQAGFSRAKVHRVRAREPRGSSGR